MEKKIFYLTLLMAVLFAGLTLGLSGSLVAANDEGETDVEDVNEVGFSEVPSNAGKFGLIGTITSVNASEKTIAVNGVTVDVSEAKIVGWRWRKFAEGTGKPWKDWWKHWTEEELKAGDKVRVGGRIEDGKLIARLVVLHAFRFAEKIRACQVDADCAYLLPPSLEGKFEAKCQESRCKPVKIAPPSPAAEEEEAVEEEEAETTRGTRPRTLQDIQEKINEVLNKINLLQSKMGTVVGGAL